MYRSRYFREYSRGSKNILKIVDQIKLSESLYLFSTEKLLSDNMILDLFC